MDNKKLVDEKLVWRRASPDNTMVNKLEGLTKILGHAVLDYSRNVQKQLKRLKKF